MRVDTNAVNVQRLLSKNDGSYRQDGVDLNGIRSKISISTSDSYSGTLKANSKATATVRMGGSTTRKADKISWAHCAKQ